jgi:uncharacterized membrane protein YqaE (UPF0057 family)
MMYLLALFLPPLAVLLCGKPFQALINLILWIPTIHLGSMIHALFVTHNYYADKRQERMIREMAKAQAAAQALNRPKLD